MSAFRDQDTVAGLVTLGMAEGMTAEEAAVWALSRLSDRKSRARARAHVSTPVVSVGLLGERDPNQQPTPTTGSKTGITFLADDALTRGEPNMVIDGLLPDGLTVLGGAPKCGKSYLCLDVAFGIGSGTSVLGSMVPDQGDVLYLALEDTSARLMKRLAERNPDRGAWPWDALTIESMQTIADGGYPPPQVIARWRDQVENPKLVIVDTITRFGGQPDRSGYNTDVRWMKGFHEGSAKNGIAMLGVTHTNQRMLEKGEDWFNKIMGTTGIIGTADTVMFLDVSPVDREGVLRLRGRDIEETEYNVRQVGPWWQVVDQLRGNRSDRSVQVVDFVLAAGRTTPQDVAEALKITTNQASVYLKRAKDAGLIGNPSRGVWASPRDL